MKFSMSDWNGGRLRFDDRRDAGRQLAREIPSRALERPIVIALPRGGVEVGYEVARALDAPLDVWVVRKIGVPWQPELGVGAVAEGGYTYIAQGMLAALGLSEGDLAETIDRKRREVDARVRIYRGGRARPNLAGRNVLVVDDGIATGGTVRAAVASIRDQHPSCIVLAVPVAAYETLQELKPEVDDVVCLLSPTAMHAIGLWYRDFEQVTNEEVVQLLERRRQERASSPATDAEASPSAR
jgi:putative phosphoribosyl transferase